jgi:hypothetical protein
MGQLEFICFVPRFVYFLRLVQVEFLNLPCLPILPLMCDGVYQVLAIAVHHRSSPCAKLCDTHSYGNAQ